MDVSVRPPKRRKTRRDVPLTEDDPEAAEAVTNEEVDYASRKGGTVKPVFIPLLPQEESAHEETHPSPPEYIRDQEHLGQFDTGDDGAAYAAKTNMVSCVNIRATITIYLGKAATLLFAGIRPEGR